MIGTMVWYDTGTGKYESVGIVVRHIRNLDRGHSVWASGPNIVENAIKIRWIKDKGARPIPISFVGDDHFGDPYFDRYLSDGIPYRDGPWYDLERFKILAKVKR